MMIRIREPEARVTIKEDGEIETSTAGYLLYISDDYKKIIARAMEGEFLGRDPVGNFDRYNRVIRTSEYITDFSNQESSKEVNAFRTFTYFFIGGGIVGGIMGSLVGVPPHEPAFACAIISSFCCWLFRLWQL